MKSAIVSFSLWLAFAFAPVASAIDLTVTHWGADLLWATRKDATGINSVDDLI